MEGVIPDRISGVDATTACTPNWSHLDHHKLLSLNSQASCLRRRSRTWWHLYRILTQPIFYFYLSFTLGVLFICLRRLFIELVIRGLFSNTRKHNKIYMISSTKSWRMSRVLVLLFLLNLGFLYRSHHYYPVIDSFHHSWSLNSRSQQHRKMRDFVFCLLFLFILLLSFLQVIVGPSVNPFILSWFVLGLLTSIYLQTISQVLTIPLSILLFQT